MSKRNGILRTAREHVFALFRAAPDHVRLEYHQFARTGEVVEACREIAKASKLSDEEREVALLCAWFYDVCYATGSEDHRGSLEACQQFLEAQRAPAPSAERVAACFAGVNGVERTASGAPAALPVDGDAASDVLHDARLAVLGSKEYVERAEILRLELERRSGKTFSDVEWTQRCIRYFHAHPYRTRFAQLAYGGRRAANLVRLQKQLRRQERDVEGRAAARSVGSKVGKATESIYYHFTRIHLGLVGLADHRTSTMIHVNAIMMSVVVALLGRKIEEHRALLLPTALLLLVNLTVLFLSVYSMRGTQKLTAEEAAQASSNLVRLVDTAPMSLTDYRERMRELIGDPAAFERQVIDHLYFGRKLLDDRARSLRRTYAVFIYGISVAIAAFVVAVAIR